MTRCGAGVFRGLKVADAAVVEARRALAWALLRRRRARGLTQVRLAALLGSSQSRVAKMEAADETVSLELLVRALVVLGATRGEVGRVVASRGVPASAARRGRESHRVERRG